MAQKAAIATIMAALFAQSQTALSEKLSTEDFNTFAAEAEEVNNRLTAQADGNTQLKADLDAANARVSTLR